MKKKRLDKLLESTLFEQPEDNTEDSEEDSEEDDEEKTKSEKDTERKTKEIKDIDKEDVEDEEDDEATGDEEIAVSVKLNDNDRTGGDIKLINFKRLNTFNTIESLLEIFDINPDEVAGDFKNKIEISIKSPVADFKDEEYKVILRDRSGEIVINRPDLKTSIEKQSKTPMGQAVQQATAEPGVEAETQPIESEAQADLSYLAELNPVFTKTIKSEFFDRLLSAKS